MAVDKGELNYKTRFKTSWWVRPLLGLTGIVICVLPERASRRLYHWVGKLIHRGIKVEPCKNDS